MLEASSKSPAEIYEILDKLTSAIENRIKSLADSSDANKHARPVDQSEEKRLEGGLQADSNSIKDSQQKIYPAEILQEIEDLKLSLAVAWIYYIHSARRIQVISVFRVNMHKI